MTPSLFRTKADEISRRVIAQKPSGSSGYLADLADHISSEQNAVQISFNGELSTDEWQIFGNLQNGSVLKMKDPRGGRAPHTVLNPRASQHITSHDGGKTSITGSPNKGEFVILDIVHMGTKFDSPCAVGTLRLTKAHDSTVTSSRQREQSSLPDPDAAPDVEQVESVDPPKKRPDSPTEKLRNMSLKDIIDQIWQTAPLPNNDFMKYMDQDGRLRVGKKNDNVTPHGSNTRTGTTNLDINDLNVGTTASYLDF